ncbi:AcrR family transcriptional regulator [Bradyrhizobium sp. GM7.3]
MRYLAAAREAAAEGGMAAVQIAPVAVRAGVAAGTVYRYFPSKADLISELIAEVSRDELTAIRRAADAAPGPSSALAAAVTTVAVHTLSQRRLAWGILAEPVDVDVSASRLASRREIAGEMASRIDAAVRAGHLPAQDTALAATALLGALHEALVGPLAPDNLDDPARMRDCRADRDAAGAPRGRRHGRPRQGARRAADAAADGESAGWGLKRHPDRPADLIAPRPLLELAFSKNLSTSAGPAGYCAWGCFRHFLFAGCRRS